MGTNGFQEPAVDFKDGKIVGSKRLYADGKFGGKDGKATFMETKWRGLQAPGKEAEKNKWPFLINNGRTNHVWQSAYLDQDNEFVMDRWPYPFIQMNPQDMAEVGVKPGDLVEVYNDNGSTQAVAYPAPSAKRKQTFMLFAYPNGVQGNAVSPAVNEFIIPNYKQTWAGIRKISDAPEGVRHLTFKSRNIRPDDLNGVCTGYVNVGYAKLPDGKRDERFAGQGIARQSAARSPPAAAMPQFAAAPELCLQDADSASRKAPARYQIFNQIIHLPSSRGTAAAQLSTFAITEGDEPTDRRPAIAGY